MQDLKLIRSAKKSCETCKFRVFDEYGWTCNRHNKYFNQLECTDISDIKCKYHKRDTEYCLCNGYFKWQDRNGKYYNYKRGKFREYKW